MTTARAADLREIARRRHVHFDVDPEIVVHGSERVKVGFEIHLWAVHAKGARALPGCAKCWELAGDLTRIAHAVVPPGDRATRSEVEPFRRALYESRVVPGADEVSVTIHLFHREGWDRPVDECEERCLREIRERLHALGIPEQ